MKIRFSRLVLAGLLLLALAGCGKKPGIARIYVLQGGFNHFIEHKVDLENRQLWTFEEVNNNRRDAAAADEGFTFVGDLNQVDIDLFLREANKYKFLSWNDQSKYSESEFLYGHNWSIIVVFSDGTQTEFFASSLYPETWDRMYDAFLDLTGKPVLGYKKDSPG